MSAAARILLIEDDAAIVMTLRRVLAEEGHEAQAKPARWLGVSRLTLREKLIQFGLHPAHDREKPPMTT